MREIFLARHQDAPKAHPIFDKKPRDLSPRKTLHGEETFLLRLDRAKATAEHGRTVPIELKGYPEDSTEGGLPKKPKTTTAPPVTQEDDGFGDLASEEE